jgi:hypothetical protein
MPYDEADETDPMMLVGVELPEDASTWRETALVLAEEFARMGFHEERLMEIFRDPFYAGAHKALLALGEEAIREIVRAASAPWKGVEFRERDADPETGLSLLPVLEPPRRNEQ